MKYRKLLLCCSLIAFSVLLILQSCQKSKSTGDISYATDHVVAEQTFNDVQNISDQAANVQSGSMLAYRTTATTASACATITRIGNIITVDFGLTDCMCNDGRNRRGKITISYTGGYYTDSASVHTISFDNFYQNDNKVTGTVTVTNMGTNASAQPFFNSSINGDIALATGGNISVTWTRVRTWTAGHSTLTYLPDDVYNISGSGQMTAANGTSVDINISSPLVIANNCHWVEAGTVSYSLSGGVNHSLNYGDIPACDDQATLTISNGTVQNITLP